MSLILVRINSNYVRELRLGLGCTKDGRAQIDRSSAYNILTLPYLTLPYGEDVLPPSAEASLRITSAEEKLYRHIIFESILMLFAKNYQN